MSAPELSNGQEQRVMVDERTCSACGRCIVICPMDVFRRADNGKPIVSYGSDCSACMLCVTDCPTDSITVDLKMPSHFVSIYDYLRIDVVPYAGPPPRGEPRDDDYRDAALGEPGEPP